MVYTDTLTNSVVYSPVVRAIQKPASSFAYIPTRSGIACTYRRQKAISLRAALYQADGTRKQAACFPAPENQWELGVPPNLPRGIYFLSFISWRTNPGRELIKQR